jgi:hypothetical protein
MQVAFSNLLGQYAIFNPSLSRRDLEQLFTDQLNKERGNLKPLSLSFVSWKMKQARLNKKDDLVAYYQMCSSKKSFAKYWWWSLKAQTEPQSLDSTTSSGVAEPVLDKSTASMVK